MDRGVPTEAVLEEMRASDPPVQYLVGTPKGRLTRLEQALLDKPWREARPGVKVKLLPQDGELYVFAESEERIAKERSMRRRQLKWLWARLAQLSAMRLARDVLLMKLGSAQTKAPAAWRLIDIQVVKENGAFTYELNRDRLRKNRRREGRYLLRTNLTETDPVKLWNYYLQLVTVEEAFRTLKGDSHHPANLPSGASTHRSARIPRLPCLLLARQPGAATEGARPRPHRTQRTGEIRRCANGRCARSDHRRPRIEPHALHTARVRSATLARALEAHPSRPADAKNHRRTVYRRKHRVVKTF